MQLQLVAMLAYFIFTLELEFIIYHEKLIVEQFCYFRWILGYMKSSLQIITLITILLHS